MSMPKSLIKDNLLNEAVTEPEPVIEDYLLNELVTGGYVRSSILVGVPKCLPLDMQVGFVHFDVVVITASGEKCDLKRTIKGVAWVQHKDDDAMTANLKFPVTNGVTVRELVDFAKERAQTSYFVFGHNCHDLTFEVCKLMGAPNTQSFYVFFKENREEFARKLKNPQSR